MSPDHSPAFSRYVIYLLPVFCLLLFYSCKKSGENPGRDSRGVISITHPGILNTASSLNFISNDANISGSWRANMFNNTVDGFIDKNIGSLLSPYPTTVYVRSSGSTPTETKMRTDAQLAYALALKWAKTHDTTIVIKAIEVLNGWAYNFNKLDTVKGTFGQQRFLEAAWVVPTFAAAAEIIRWYNVNDDNTSLWPPEDITQFEAFLRKMMYEYAGKTFASGFKNNWYVSAAYAKMAASVFLNDIAGYNNGYDRLKEILPLMILNDGTLPEFCSRTDCVHFQYSLTGITLGAELDRIQSGSTELYEYGGRIGKGYAFMRLAYSGGANGCNFCDPTKEVYPGVAVAYRYFANDNTTFLTTLKQPTYGVNADKTFLGFTMYTHYNVP